MSDSNPVVIQWALDTRKLWPQAAETKQLRQHAARALALLEPQQREDVLRYIHCRDAKMSLGSHLLKRYVISRYLDVPWQDAVTTRNKDTKPVFYHPKGTQSEPLIFNVSHQAGLVVLAAALYPATGVTVGVDIVCPSERRERDRKMVAERNGWRNFLDIHADVFSPLEVEYLDKLPAGYDTDRKLRYFYTLWCLREAYVKMTGEALLAPWLRVLEMRAFAPPEESENVGPLQIYFRGQRVDEKVDVQLINYLGEFMIGTAVGKNDKGESLSLGDYELLDMDKIVEFGEQAKTA